MKLLKLICSYKVEMSRKRTENVLNSDLFGTAKAGKFMLDLTLAPEM